MKYFTNELWKQFSSPDEAVRKNAGSIWADNTKAYAAQLRSLARKVPHSTMAAIRKISSGEVDLHDSRLMGISFSSTESEHSRLSRALGRPPRSYERTFHLQVTDGATNVELIMQGMNKMCVEMEYWQETGFDVRWGYCEFSYRKPYVVLSILWESGHVWELEFTALTIVQYEAKRTKGKG